MITYEYYKAMHLFFILSLFSSVGFVVCNSDFMQKKSGKIMSGLFSFLIFVTAMGLLARLGHKHSEPFPLWVKLKIGNWVLINCLFVSLFKIKTREYKTAITGIIFVAAWCGIWLAINKPL